MHFVPCILSRVSWSTPQCRNAAPKCREINSSACILMTKYRYRGKRLESTEIVGSQDEAEKPGMQKAGVYSMILIPVPVLCESIQMRSNYSVSCNVFLDL